MIERGEVNGRPAWIAYLTGNMEPVDKSEATYIKALFDDLTSAWIWLTDEDRENDGAEDDFDPSEARDPGGKWTGSGGAAANGQSEKGASFVSPAVENHDFASAVKGLQSPRQKQLIAVSRQVDQALGIRSSDLGAVGAWSDGAENAVMTQTTNASFDQLKLAAAIKGDLYDQKAVLAFHDNPEGTAHLFSFEAPGSLEDIHAGLLEDGVAFHTLVPRSSGGARVYVVGMDEDTAHAVVKGAGRYGAAINAERGDAAFIGTEKSDGSDREQRDDAHDAYRRAIDGAGDQRALAVWQRLRDSLGQASDAGWRSAKPAARWRS